MAPFSNWDHLVVVLDVFTVGGIRESGDCQVTFSLGFLISQMRLKVDPVWKTKYLTWGRIIGFESSVLFIFPVETKN